MLLTFASIAGGLCIVGAVAAAMFQLTLMLFSTGSMSPTIPAGAVALVRQIPASEARIGDVVTVDRPGAMPITHRVVSTRPLADGRTELVLRGDANAENDPAPYDVSQVRIVIASVPGGAELIAFLSNPFFLGGATLAATGLVAWAFWPRAGDRQTRRGRGGTAGPFALLGAAGGGIALALAAPAPAQAAESISTSRYLTLTSNADSSAFTDLRPGVPVRWEIGVAATTPSLTIVWVGLSSAGALTDSLDVAVTSCTVRWEGDACPGTQRALVESKPLGRVLAAVTGPRAPLGAVAVGAMPSVEQRWLAIDVTLQPGASAGTADIDVWAWTAEEEVRATAPPAGLAPTGTASTLWPPVLAGVAVAAGTTIAASVGRRHRWRRA